MKDQYLLLAQAHYCLLCPVNIPVEFLAASQGKQADPVSTCVVGHMHLLLVQVAGPTHPHAVLPF